PGCRHDVLRGQHPGDRPQHRDPVRCRVGRARRRRHLDLRARPGVPAGGRAHGDAGRGGLEARRGAAGRPRGHPVLPTDGRAGRASRVVPAPPVTMATLPDVAVVGLAQAPVVARDEHRVATELLYPQVRRALAECGVGRDAIDYQVAGSADYVDGRPFGFVAALDVTGSWPPRQDLHLEMDAAFAAYYAWIRMQAGDCDTALVCGYGKNSEGELERLLDLRLDPYYQVPIGLTPTAPAALQASAYIARTGPLDPTLTHVAARDPVARAR